MTNLDKRVFKFNILWGTVYATNCIKCKQPMMLDHDCSREDMEKSFEKKAGICDRCKDE